MSGTIEVICGPMYSGKTEELLRRLNIRKIQRMGFIVFKPNIDDRWILGEAVSRNGRSIEAIPISESNEILNFISPEIQVIGIDEAQFFDLGLIDIVQKLSDKGKQVFITGLDTDYRRQPFGPMPFLLSIADKVDKLQAVCHSCFGPATLTQRLLDGIPASFSGPTIQVGASEAYEARCRDCFEPG